MAEDDGLDCLDLWKKRPRSCAACANSRTTTPIGSQRPIGFSVAEVLAHLSHSEGHCYRMRIDQFLKEELPEFEQDDA